MSYFVRAACVVCGRYFTFTRADPYKLCVGCFQRGSKLEEGK